MSDESPIATLPDEGVGAQNVPSQDTEHLSQDNGQRQEAGSIEVGNSDSQASSALEEARPKPSEFYRFRKKISKLENSIGSVNQRLEQIFSVLEQKQSAASSNSENGQQDLTKSFWENPLDTVNKLIAETIEKSIPQSLNKHLSQRDHERETQDAVNIVFSNELIKKDPDGVERIQEILKENGLDLIGEKSPVQAAKTAIRIYELERKTNSSRSSFAPAKSQMQSVASGMPASGRPMTKEQIATEAEKIRKQMSDNPDSAQDPKVIARLKFLSESAQKQK